MPIKRLIWKQEERLHTPLEITYGSSKVHAKVRMVDVIAAEDRNLTSAEKDFLFKAHFDFIIIDENKMPVVVFELDGKQHNYDRKQIERDKKKDSICQKAGLPLIRISYEFLDQIDQLATLQEKDPRFQDIRDIYADIIKFLHEYETSVDFRIFMLFFNQQNRVAFFLENCTLSQLIEIVREEGVLGALQHFISTNRILDANDNRKEQSGFSENQWYRYGLPAWIALINLRLKRSQTLGTGLDNYLNTEEAQVLENASLWIGTKSDEGYEPEDIIAYYSENTKTSIQILDSLLNLKVNYPTTIDLFIENLSALAKIISEDGANHIAQLLATYKVLEEYVNEFKVVQADFGHWLEEHE